MYVQRRWFFNAATGKCIREARVPCLQSKVGGPYLFGGGGVAGTHIPHYDQFLVKKPYFLHHHLQKL